MANKKIFADLTELTTAADADVLPIVDDTTGTPTTKKISVSNLMAQAPVQSVAGRDGAVTLSNTDISGLGTAATQDTGTSANNVVQLDSTAKLPAVDGSQLTGIDTSVEGTAVLSTGETGGAKFLREDGDGTCSWQESPLSYATQTYTASGTPLAFTLTSAAKGKVVVVNETSNVFVTVPQGLGSNFNCRFVQLGVGRVIVIAGSGATVGAYTPGTSAFNTTAGQYAGLDLVPTGTDAYVVFGETSASPFINNYSLSFDGTNDLVGMGSLAGLNSATEFSISWWFKRTSTTNRIFWSGGSNDRCAISSSGIEVRVGGTVNTFGSTNYNNGNWRQVTFTYNAGTGKVYIDGSSTPIDTKTNYPTSTAGTAYSNFKIGTVANLYWFDGLQDEYGVWSTELSGAEVADLQASSAPIDLSSNNGNYTSSSNLIHYWRMGDNDSGSGTTVTDIAGNNDGSINGATFSTDTP